MNTDTESLNGHLRSAAHFIIFFILTILSFWCFGFLGVAGAAVWAALDEVTKIPVPGRHYSFKDVMKNMLGVGLGVLIVIVSMNMVEGAAVPTTEVQRQQITTAENAVFAWDGVVESDLKLLEKHSIGIVLLDINHTDSIRLLSDYTVLILCGDPAWTVEDYSSAITTAKGLNASGIVFDIENDYNVLADNLAQLHTDYHIADFHIYACIPFWLDDTEPRAVERIMASTDGTFVMNYYRENERQQMQNEITLADKHGKLLWSIYELQPVGIYELKDYNTYHDLGIGAVKENYRSMFSGSSVGLAYHNLAMLR